MIFWPKLASDFHSAEKMMCRQQHSDHKPNPHRGPSPADSSETCFTLTGEVRPGCAPVWQSCLLSGIVSREVCED